MSFASRGPAFAVRDIPFSFRGSWFGISPVTAENSSADDLHLVSHQTGMHAVLRLEPRRHGARADCAVTATPTRLTQFSGTYLNRDPGRRDQPPVPGPVREVRRDGGRLPLLGGDRQRPLRHRTGQSDQASFGPDDPGNAEQTQHDERPADHEGRHAGEAGLESRLTRTDVPAEDTALVCAKDATNWRRPRMTATPATAGSP